MSVKSITRSIVAPAHETMWDKAVDKRKGAYIDDHKQIEPGRTERVPVFNSRIARIDYDESPTVLSDKLERPEGIVHRHDTLMNDGIYRAANVYIPDERVASEYPFIVSIDTPWFTGVHGHNDDIAQLFMRELGVPVVLVGPEYSRQDPGCLVDPRLVGKAAMGSLALPQALSAEGSAEITAELAEHHNLARQVIKGGESRGGMVSMGVHPYAGDRELEYIYYELTDPCVAERLFASSHDAKQLAKFVLYESAGILKVGGKLLHQGTLRTKAGTFSHEPDFLAGATVGTTRAISSGEAGVFPAWIPHNAPVHLLSMLLNTMSSHNRWPELFSQHTKFAHLTLHDMHFGLGDASVPRHILGRAAALGDALCAGGPIDYRKVHMRDDESVLGVVA